MADRESILTHKWATTIGNFMPRQGLEPYWNGQRATDYPAAPQGLVSDSLAIPLGFESSPGYKISICGSPLMSKYI